MRDEGQWVSFLDEVGCLWNSWLNNSIEMEPYPVSISILCLPSLSARGSRNPLDAVVGRFNASRPQEA